MSSDYCNEEGKFQLLVEGKTDCHATIAIWNHHYAENRFKIKTCESDENVLKKLNALIVSSQRPNVIGIVLDADDEPAERRLQQINSKIEKYGYDLPDNLNSRGTVIESVESFPKIGIWIMPNNKDQGLIEDFYIKLAPSEVISHVNEVVENAVKEGYTKFREVHKSKAVIHTFLSWQDEPGYPIGKSITALKFDCDYKDAISFVNWLNDLFQ